MYISIVNFLSIFFEIFFYQPAGIILQIIEMDT